MEKEGASLIARPRSIAAGDILSGGLRLVTESSGERVRRLRRYTCGFWRAIGTEPEDRVLHTGLQSKVAGTYEPFYTKHAKNLILDILNDPNSHQMHVKRYESSSCSRNVGSSCVCSYAASVVMSISYGKTTPTAYTDPEVVAVIATIARFGRVAQPGAYLVDTFPILRFVPGYLNQLKEWHKEELQLFGAQLDIVRRQIVSGFVFYQTASLKHREA
jgi:hypothetical protein